MSKHAGPISLPPSHLLDLLSEVRPPEAVAYRLGLRSATASAWFPPLDAPPLACLHKADGPRELPPGRYELHFYDENGDEISIGPPPRLLIGYDARPKLEAPPVSRIDFAIDAKQDGGSELPAPSYRGLVR